jgi:type IV pilus assembly protein PilF
MGCRFRLPALAILWIFAVTSCAHFGEQDPSLQYSGAKLTEIGQKYLAAGELGLAIKYLMAAEKKQPKDPKVHYYLGVAYDQRGLPGEAVAHFQKAVELKPNYSEVYNSLGVHYAENGSLDKAEDAFKKALSNPAYETPFFAFYNLGSVYEKKNMPEDALKQYQQAVRLHAGYGVAYYRMGVVLESLNRVDEARDAYGKAVNLNPNISEAQLRYGILSYNAGDIEHALTSLARVIKMSPYTAMASEARKYLDRMQGMVGGARSRGGASGGSDRSSSFEVVSEGGASRGPKAAGSAPASRVGGVYEVGGDLSGGVPAPSDAAPTSAISREPDRPERADGSSSYVVQVGTFRDKENAERVRERLREMGYEAVVKTFPHQSLGSLYSVQIRPVDEISVANALVAEIEKVERLKPIILKVRGNP